MPHHSLHPVSKQRLYLPEKEQHQSYGELDLGANEFDTNVCTNTHAGVAIFHPKQAIITSQSCDGEAVSAGDCVSTFGVEALDKNVEFALSSFRASDSGPTNFLALIVSAFLLELLFVVV